MNKCIDCKNFIHCTLFKMINRKNMYEIFEGAYDSFLEKQDCFEKSDKEVDINVLN